ncbi:hypothetical protein [Heyndrickxia acidicola]|uniref:Uncharacterized protein n=1 Tax=Heyndrickxia acidicola TaxID=209389 RepID=A0ABU6MML6_9BACI|nr:hypothetical protein [Heyndrickxia acidicola]MED1204300.1 hypothetical protein [Heyndrickxia acidicola]
MKKVAPLEAILWSIAFPGFPQLLSGKYIKGFLFLFLEFLVNGQSHFNKAIMLSFLGDTRLAGEIVNYQWLMFYPCIYMFAMWDAYKNSLERESQFSYIPFAFAAYFVTIGLMYSPIVTIKNRLIGPIFLPILFIIPGLVAGFFIRYILIKIRGSM